MDTWNQTRGSCARVKLEVDLLRDFSKRKNIIFKKKDWRNDWNWVKINYDYVSKYCLHYRIQGHDEQKCYVIHLKLFSKKKEEETKADQVEDQKGKIINEGIQGSKGDDQSKI